MSVITAPLSPTQSFDQFSNFDGPNSTTQSAKTLVQTRSRPYLKEADVEYLRLLEDALDEVRRLIEEVNHLPSSKVTLAAC